MLPIFLAIFDVKLNGSIKGRWICHLSQVNEILCVFIPVVLGVTSIKGKKLDAPNLSCGKMIAILVSGKQMPELSSPGKKCHQHILEYSDALEGGNNEWS